MIVVGEGWFWLDWNRNSKRRKTGSAGYTGAGAGDDGSGRAGEAGQAVLVVAFAGVRFVVWDC